ncbi:nucleic acid-binding protein [Artomyces pyxidatus]|uniref:Nucleic acid-binding protein n=1 Tax=Artomyces pyxidatus TaxID=48021 RepID=A0ACB8TL85_9AGAM|nr:nucleic acid-binding protein [Artomyces pyxidatus]
MFAAVRQVAASRSASRAFSTTTSRSSDVAKLILIGRLGKEPEVRTTKTDKEYVTYTVATTNYPPPPPNPDGTREESKTTWHHILSFNAGANNFLRNLQRGSHVYVEANYELREPDSSADPNTPQGQRQIFLRHENLRLLRAPPKVSDSSEGDSS